MTIKALHILMTDYSIDSRVRNETNSLLKSGCDVTVLCMNGSGLPRVDLREGVKIRRYGVKSIKILQFLTSYVGMLFYSIFRPVDIVHAHDLTSLPIAFVISLIKRSKLVYDSHELWSQSHHKDHPRLFIYTMELFERVFGRRCNAVVSVSSGISEYLKNYLNVDEVATIRNIPSYTQAGEYNLFRDTLGISPDQKIFLYQGLISETRGVDVLFNAALELSSRTDITFIFMGDGPFSANIQTKLRSASPQVKKSVYYLPPVSQDELLKYTMSADVGVHAIRNTCLNHDLCLPNKLFEYITSGLPVIVTDLTEMSKLVREHEIGLCFEDDNVASLVEKISELLNDTSKLRAYQHNALALRKTMNWENESKVLLALYEKLTND